MIRSGGIGPRKIIVAVLVPFVFGCGSRVAYSPPPARAAESATPVSAPYDQLWAAVVQTFFQKNIPVRTIEKESGILESGELRGEIGKECDCGTYLGIGVGGYGGAYGGDAYYSFRVLVQRDGDRTSLILRSTCRARAENVTGELVCHLMPARENEVRDAILSQAGASPKPVETTPKAR